MKQRPIIETRSGEGINLLEPDPRSINIEDIAYGLSYQCRFGGHVSRFYSVAEHTLLCSFLAEDLTREKQQAIFLHDAHEAYLGDIPTPIKRILSGFTEIVDRFDGAIKERFLLESFDFPELKEIDRLALSIEANKLMAFRFENWYDGGLIDDFPEVSQVRVLKDRSYNINDDQDPKLIRELFLLKAENLFN